jgi:hypothetical protein
MTMPTIESYTIVFLDGVVRSTLEIVHLDKTQLFTMYNEGLNLYTMHLQLPSVSAVGYRTRKHNVEHISNQAIAEPKLDAPTTTCLV